MERMNKDFGVTDYRQPGGRDAVEPGERNENE
jgi:hypothetical protein